MHDGGHAECGLIPVNGNPCTATISLDGRAVAGGYRAFMFLRDSPIPHYPRAPVRTSHVGIGSSGMWRFSLAARIPGPDPVKLPGLRMWSGSTP